jgi:hypothetical protein
MKGKARTKRPEPRLGSHLEDDSPLPPESIGEPPQNKMDATETRYARHLDELLQRGEILFWVREPISIMLARNSYYRPDFLVMQPDKSLEVHEVKGRGGQNFHSRKWHHPHRDGYTKWKIAASKLPVVFMLVWPENGGWAMKKALT